MGAAVLAGGGVDEPCPAVVDHGVVECPVVAGVAVGAVGGVLDAGEGQRDLAGSVGLGGDGAEREVEVVGR